MTINTRTSSLRGHRIIALMMVVAALSLAGPVGLARAADPTNAQYANPITKVGGEVGKGSAPAAAKPSGLEKRVVGGLPVTGLDVVALGAVAIALMSLGIGLRRLTAERSL
jgi:hypothetical protein